MFPFLRPTEEPRSGRTKQVGVLITTPTKKWLFPGGDTELAMILARAVLDTTVLDHPMTRIEFGEMVDSDWVPSKIMKASVDDGPDT